MHLMMSAISLSCWPVRLALLLLLAVGAQFPPVNGQEKPPLPPRSTRKNTPPKIDLSKIPEADRVIAARILREATIVQPLQERIVNAGPKTYGFLLDRLDLAGTLVETWKLGRYQILLRGQDQFLVDDRQGAVAVIRTIHSEQTPNSFRRLFLADGYFKIPLVPGARVDGKGIIYLEYEPTGNKQLRTRAWLFFRIDNKLLSRLSRFLKTIVQRVISKKCNLFIKAAAEVSERLEAKPARTYELIGQLEKLGKIPPSYRKDLARIFDLGE